MIARIGPNERQDPYHFGLSLVRRIKDCPHQEIGTHTFSHYYCLEDGQTPEHFPRRSRGGPAVGSAPRHHAA